VERFGPGGWVLLEISSLPKLPKILLATVFCLATAFPFSKAAPASKAVNFSRGRNGIVCLTIDDGFNKKSIQTALDVLRRKNVKCTFFIIGRVLKPYAKLWRQAVADGHEICYHSMRHGSQLRWSRAAILRDVEKWNATAHEVLGPEYIIPKFARLPGGAGQHSARIQAVYASIGYKLIYWSSDTYTGVIAKSRRDLNKRITNYIKKTTGKNSIILTHFNGYDVPALPDYIDWLTRNFTLGTVSEAFAQKTVPVPPKNGICKYGRQSPSMFFPPYGPCTSYPKPEIYAIP
jgi:peptidoglycan/xylan/chitin deacetylase (PgdA/CDA1 family)